MVRGVLTLGPAKADTLPAVRIAVSLAVPLTVVALVGRLDWSLFVAFGAFTSIYSRYTPTFVRVQQQLAIGGILTASVGFGSVLAHAALLADDASHAAILKLLVVIGGTLTAGVASVLIMLGGYRPTGAMFPVFAATAVASAPVSAPIWLAVGISSATVLWCIVLSMLTHWVGEAHWTAGAPAPGPFTRSQIIQEFGRYASAALIAGTIASIADIPSPYWAQVAAVVPLSAPGRRLQVERGVHRIVGTTLGVAVTAFLLSFPSQPWQLIIWVVLMQFLAEMFVLRNYSLALMFVTPLALLMVHLANPGPAVPMLIARVAETTIGAVVGIAIVFIGLAIERARRQAD